MPAFLSKFFWATLCLLVTTTFSTALATTNPPWENGMSRGEDLEIEIYTFGPGPSLEEWWGHIGLLIRDTRRHRESMYNWGMFTFDEKLLRNFVTGRLRFWAASEPVLPSVAFYRRQGRIIHAIPLNLTPPQKLELANTIATNMKPENREYDYEYLRDNCSTRIRDHINTLSGGTFATGAKAEAGKGTFRSLINTITAHNVGMNLLIMFLLGPTVDVPNTKWDDMFLPSELESYLVEKSARATNPSDAIVGPLKVIHAGNRHYPQAPLAYFPFDILAGTAFGVVAIGLSILFHRKPRLAKSLLALQTLLFGTLFGVVGTVLLFFNLFTWHSYTFWNENLFFGNPVTLALVPLAVLVMNKRFSWATTWTMRVCAFLTALALIGFVFKALPISHQDNAVFVRSVMPALSLLAVAWFRVHRASGSTTRKNVS